jgi:hypothetical protein
MFRSCAGWLPPLFDHLQQRLAAIAQALARLELVEQGDDLARQPGQHPFASGARIRCRQARERSADARERSADERRVLLDSKSPDPVIGDSVGLNSRSVYKLF